MPRGRRVLPRRTREALRHLLDAQRSILNHILRSIWATCCGPRFSARRASEGKVPLCLFTNLEESTIMNEALTKYGNESGICSTPSCRTRWPRTFQKRAPKLCSSGPQHNTK